MKDRQPSQELSKPAGHKKNTLRRLVFGRLAVAGLALGASLAGPVACASTSSEGSPQVKPTITSTAIESTPKSQEVYFSQAMKTNILANDFVIGNVDTVQIKPDPGKKISFGMLSGINYNVTMNTAVNPIDNTTIHANDVQMGYITEYSIGGDGKPTDAETITFIINMSADNATKYFKEKGNDLLAMKFNIRSVPNVINAKTNQEVPGQEGIKLVLAP